MSDSITLHEILSQYRKSNLVEIAKLHHLHGYSQYKKAQMVEFLCRALLDADVMRKYFMYLSEAELELLDSGESQVWIESNENQYDYLAEGAYIGIGYDWDGGVVCVPEEVRKAYLKNCDTSWKQSLNTDKKLLMYLNVLSELYGVCSIEQVINLYVRDGGSKKELFEVISFCEAIPENKKYFELRGEKLILKLWTDGNMYKELQKRQGGCPFYEPTKEEIEHLGTKGYLPFDKYMLELKDFFIKEGHEGEQEAELICKTIQMIIRTGGTYEHIRDVLEVGFMDFDYIAANEKLQRQLLRRIDNVWEHTNTVMRRGHMIKEIVAEEPKSNIIVFPGKR